ncbi:MAG: type II toxin-antitoxin system RelE/ParE family toxin [Pseudomonadota bacterium]|nr:type II toxin-antitoxin system RelE/ParE family toxin [Sphingobium naphthae]
MSYHAQAPKQSNCSSSALRRDERLADLFEQTAERLVDHPHMHRTGRFPGSREALVTPNCLIIYRVALDAIEILAVKHTRQQYP